MSNSAAMCAARGSRRNVPRHLDPLRARDVSCDLATSTEAMTGDPSKRGRAGETRRVKGRRLGGPPADGELARLGELSTWTDSREAAPAPAFARPPELPVGARVGPFRIEWLLGRGGMGIVYRARDERLDRLVALKITAPGRADAELLRREARRAAAVDHPQVATVYEVGEHGGHTYIAMELVDGLSLRRRLGAPIATRDAVSIARQVAAVLAHAHDRGLVHRDLKPENIMVRPDGSVKVLDFGLATVIGPRGDAEPVLVGGTFGYMAPEQRTGRGDARSDVHAFGVLLHELFTRRHPPRDGLSPGAADDVPRRFRALVRRCLAINPDLRPADGGELVAALASLRARRRRIAYAAAIAGVAGVAAAVVGGRSGPAAPRFVALTAQGASVPVQDADLSPDGRTVVFAERRGLVRLDVASRETALVRGDGGFYCVRWMADGRRVVAYDRRDGGRLLEVDAWSGAARPLPVARPGCAAPSPDGRWLVVDADGLRLHRIADLGGAAPDPGAVLLPAPLGPVVSRAVWSPDSARVAVLARPPRSTRDAVVYGIDVPSGRRAELVRDPWVAAPFGLGAMAWETPTRLAFVLTPRAPLQDRPATLHTIDVDPSTGTAAAPVLREELGAIAIADLRFDAARQHLLAVRYQSDDGILVGNLVADGAGLALRGVEPFTFSTRAERVSAWSRDGASLWFVAETERDHRAMRQRLGGYPEAVGPAGWTSWPVERSDGAVFAWDVDPAGARSGAAAARVVRLDGDRATEVFRPDAPVELGHRTPPPVLWRTRCAAGAPRCFAVHAGPTELAVFDLDGGQRLFAVPGVFRDARPSADGARFLLVGNRADLLVTDAVGATLEEIARPPGCGFTDAAWTAGDRGWLAATVCLDRAETFGIVSIAADPAARTMATLWSSPSVMARDLEVSPDGTRLAFTQETFACDLVLRPWRRRE